MENIERRGNRRTGRANGRGGYGDKRTCVIIYYNFPAGPGGGWGSVTDSDLPGHRASAAYLSSTTEDHCDVIPTGCVVGAATAFSKSYIVTFADDQPSSFFRSFFRADLSSFW